MKPPKNKDDIFLKETEALHNLKVLEEIEKNPEISQRELSRHLGVALGITNALLKTLVRKGLIKIRGENNRSLTYHLTHTGVLAKSALAVKWALNTVDFYRQARGDVAEKLAAIASDGIKTVLLYGVGDVSEIAVLVAQEVGLEVKGCILSGDEEAGRDSLLGYAVGSDALIEEKTPDALVVCLPVEPDVAKTIRAYERLGPKVYFLME